MIASATHLGSGTTLLCVCRVSAVFKFYRKGVTPQRRDRRRGQTFILTKNDTLPQVAAELPVR
jgi:hypothetical protein